MASWKSASFLHGFKWDLLRVAQQPIIHGTPKSSRRPQREKFTATLWRHSFGLHCVSPQTSLWHLAPCYHIITFVPFPSRSWFSCSRALVLSALLLWFLLCDFASFLFFLLPCLLSIHFLSFSPLTTQLVLAPCTSLLLPSPVSSLSIFPCLLVFLCYRVLFFVLCFCSRAHEYVKLQTD